MNFRNISSWCIRNPVFPIARTGAEDAARVVLRARHTDADRRRIRVIGDSRTLAGALDIPGGVLDVLSQSNAQGTVTQRTDVVISSLRAAPAPQYARPAPEKTG